MPSHDLRFTNDEFGPQLKKNSCLERRMSDLLLKMEAGTGDLEKHDNNIGLFF